jgi:hypothetical protein
MDKLFSVLPIAFAAAIVLVSIVIILRMMVRMWRSRTEEEGPRAPTPEEVEALAFSMMQEEEARIPRCPCGGIATHAAPRLVRSRTGWLRAFFGVAPLYRRVVPKFSEGGELTFCETHAHVADSMMDRFIYERVRAVLAEANERISIEAASFETENLLSQIKTTLEPVAPKKKEISPSQPPVRLLTGT